MLTIIIIAGLALSLIAVGALIMRRRRQGPIKGSLHAQIWDEMAAKGMAESDLAYWSKIGVALVKLGKQDQARVVRTLVGCSKGQKNAMKDFAMMGGSLKSFMPRDLSKKA